MVKVQLLQQFDLRVKHFSRLISSLTKNQAFINGEWVGGTDTFDVRNPANGELITTVPNMGREETVKSIEAASEAFKTWKNTTANDRSALLKKWHNLCNERIDDLAKIMTSEIGKPFAEAKGEINYGIGFLEWFAEEARRMYGDVRGINYIL